MKDHINYLKYIIRHKYFVYVAAKKMGCSTYRALVHDLSKFMPQEWFPYVHTFYKPDGKSQYKETIDFKLAWNHHQKYNKHHWQYWILHTDSGDDIILEMPDKYVNEMIADWLGAGRAINKKWEVWEWYEKNKSRITLHNQTREYVEYIMETIKKWDWKN